LACPYFMPTESLEGGAWLHPSRLPLGGGWTGHCTAPGHAGTKPELAQLQECCNLGYATSCPRLPADRLWDAVRFAVAREDKTQVILKFVCERNHRPVQHGQLRFELGLLNCSTPHRDDRIQQMAACFVQSHVARTR
jgi:hypothetical protein